MSTINMTKMLTKQGVDKNTLHEAVVVDNKDPDKLGRIRARVKELHQGIEDKHLPWAIPRFAHVDGAKGGKDFDRSGTFYVPKKGHKVLIEYQDGDPHHPIWHGYTVDEKTSLKEVNKNYPDRAIIRFSNGSFALIDSKTNEIFLHSPGDYYLVIQGDVEQEVHGNVQEVCADSQSNAIDKYFLNDKELPIKEAKQHQQKKVKWKGLGNNSKSGNRHIEVTGDFTLKIGGDRITKIAGDDKVTVGGDQIIKVGGKFEMKAGSSATLQSGGTMTIKGSTIKLN